MESLESKKVKGFLPSAGIWVTVLFILMLIGLHLTHYDPFNALGGEMGPERPISTIGARGIWFWNNVVPPITLCVVGYFVYKSVKTKTVTWWLLFAIGAASMFPFESFCDWGGMLTWSPEFPNYGSQTIISFPWHVNELPTYTIWAYAAYWGFHAFLLAKGIHYLMEKKGWSKLKAILVLAVPTGYILNLCVEGFSTYMGWWQYEPIIGPYIDWSHVSPDHVGTYPLFDPVVIAIIWPTTIAILTDSVGESKYELHKIDKFFHLETLLPVTHPSHPDYTGDPEASPEKFAWKFEITRVFIWIGIFVWTYCLCMWGPLMIIRYIAGIDSVYAPLPTLAEGKSLAAGFVFLACTLILAIALYFIEKKRAVKALS